MEHFKASGTHIEIGNAIGKHFSYAIRRAVQENPELQDKFLPFHGSPEGQHVFRELFVLHKRVYPHYILELQGIADGAGVSFEELFIINLRGEYRSFTAGASIQGCSTVSVKTDQQAVMGHNEDGLPIYKDKSYIVGVELSDHPSFTAFSYPGFLCGNAFGFNGEGICFCINDVRPSNIRIGIGRHFLARSPFDAHSIDDAVNRITPENRASGFNYTIGAINERRIVNVEATPTRFTVKEIDGIDYRANHYLDLEPIDQSVGESSRVRVERAADLVRKQTDPDTQALLHILSDQEDPNYPIYRNAQPPDDIATLATGLFDLDAKILSIYSGHPIHEADNRIDIAM